VAIVRNSILEGSVSSSEDWRGLAAGYFAALPTVALMPALV